MFEITLAYTSLFFASLTKPWYIVLYNCWSPLHVGETVLRLSVVRSLWYREFFILLSWETFRVFIFPSLVSLLVRPRRIYRYQYGDIGFRRSETAQYHESKSASKGWPAFSPRVERISRSSELYRPSGSPSLFIYTCCGWVRPCSRRKSLKFNTEQIDRIM